MLRTVVGQHKAEIYLQVLKKMNSHVTALIWIICWHTRYHW